MMTSHPTGATYYASRSAARAAAGRGDKVVRLGAFAGGSFGVHPPQLPNGRFRGQRVGSGGFGPVPSVVVWMVAPK